jgi:RHS repeat-associated protein
VMAVYTRRSDTLRWVEQHLYGSGRLGMYRQDTAVNKGLKAITKMYEGKRQYELSNHLGNVLTVISDRRTYTISGTTKIYDAVVLSASDYYPFGMGIDARTFSSTTTYRYSFNGKEDDKETGLQDYGMRIYDKRLGKFLSVDPLTSKYPMLTPYQFASNSPIQAIDLDGLEGRVVVSGSGRNDSDLSKMTSPDNNQFETEAKLAKKNGLVNDLIPASIDKPIISGYDMITQLENYSKVNDGIEFLMILSHGDPGKLLINTGMDSKPSTFTTHPVFKNVITGGNVPLQYEKIPITTLSLNSNIKFTKNALVVFAGCNTGCRLTDNQNEPSFKNVPSVAEAFTGVSGVPSIGSMGSTYPDGNVRKVQDNKDTPYKEGYYLFQKQKDGSVNKEFLGGSLTKELIDKAQKIIKENTKISENVKKN